MKDETKLKDMTNFLENVYKDIKEQPTIEEEQKQEKEFINKIKGNNTNEIKEIIKLCCEEEIEVKFFAKDDSLMDTYMDCDQLLDYITNLQEDLANYVNVVLHNRKVINNLQQRIDKAVEYIKWNLDKNEELIEYFNYDANFNELLKILKGEE